MAAILVGCPTIPPETPLTLDDTALQGSLKDDQDLEKRPFSEEEKAQSRGKLGGVWVSCYRSFQPSGDAQADLGRLTTNCGRPTGLVPITQPRIGEPQSDKDAIERFAFRGRGGRCYRIFAVGAAEVVDLDVAVLNESGRLAAADLSHDRWPVVPPRGPLCLEKDTVLSVEVAVAQGSGNYVIQVLADESGSPGESPGK